MRKVRLGNLYLAAAVAGVILCAVLMRAFYMPYSGFLRTVLYNILIFSWAIVLPFHTIIMTQSALFCNSVEKSSKKFEKTIQMVGAEIVRFLYDEGDKSYSLQGRRAAPCGGSFWTRNTL